MTQRMKNIFDGMLSLFDFTSDESDARIERLRELRNRFAHRSDSDALRGDWEKIGQDLYNVLSKYDEKHPPRA